VRKWDPRRGGSGEGSPKGGRIRGGRRAKNLDFQIHGSGAPKIQRSRDPEIRKSPEQIFQTFFSRSLRRERSHVSNEVSLTFRSGISLRLFRLLLLHFLQAFLFEDSPSPFSRAILLKKSSPLLLLQSLSTAIPRAPNAQSIKLSSSPPSKPLHSHPKSSERPKHLLPEVGVQLLKSEADFSLRELTQRKEKRKEFVCDGETNITIIESHLR